MMLPSSHLCYFGERLVSAIIAYSAAKHVFIRSQIVFSELY